MEEPTEERRSRLTSFRGATPSSTPTSPTSCRWSPEPGAITEEAPDTARATSGGGVVPVLGQRARLDRRFCLTASVSMEEQDVSRTEFDSCDQYSMAAEKDSGRSDVSDIGSDNVSLMDEEQQTPRDCAAQRSLRTAALSLRLLHNPKAEQQSARLFAQSLSALLPRLLRLASTAEVDAALQNLSSTFCAGLQTGQTPLPENASLPVLALILSRSLSLSSSHCLSPPSSTTSRWDPLPGL